MKVSLERLSLRVDYHCYRNGVGMTQVGFLGKLYSNQALLSSPLHWSSISTADDGTLTGLDHVP